MGDVIPLRDDFGTVRLDSNFSNKDSLNAVYTVDDSATYTPTSTNAYSTDVESLREQGLIRFRLGDFRAAANNLEQYLKLQPSGSLADQTRAQLRQIEELWVRRN